jgi:hypothetical protein
MQFLKTKLTLREFFSEINTFYRIYSELYERAVCTTYCFFFQRFITNYLRNVKKPGMIYFKVEDWVD